MPGAENNESYIDFVTFWGCQELKILIFISVLQGFWDARGASGPLRLQHYRARRFFFNKGFSSAQREIQATSKIHLPGNIKLT